MPAFTCHLCKRRWETPAPSAAWVAHYRDVHQRMLPCSGGAPLSVPAQRNANGSTANNDAQSSLPF